MMRQLYRARHSTPAQARDPGGAEGSFPYWPRQEAVRCNGRMLRRLGNNLGPHSSRKCRPAPIIGAQRIAGLDLLGIADSFEVIVDLSDVSEPKPSPEIYLTAVSRLVLALSQCMVVEDALTGVLSAKRAGCVVSALTRTFKSEALLEVGADFTFESFAKLQCFLENDLRNQAKPGL